MKDENAKITIVVTVYNKEKYVRQCMDSIFYQTDQRFKLIVIDDGSTDNSYRICKKLSADHGDIAISKVHGGASSARNLGIEMANTDYIFFVDGDDILSPDAVKRLNEAIRYRLDLVVFGINYAHTNGRVVFKDRLKNQLYKDKKEIKENLVAFWDSNLMSSSCNKLFSLRLIKECNLRFKNKEFGEDLTFVCEYTRICSSIRTLDRCLYTYREHILDSGSKKIRNDFFEIWKKIYFEWLDYFEDMGTLNESALEFISRRYIERVIGCIENEVSLRNNSPLKMKYIRIYRIISDETVIKSVKYSKPKSMKMKILSWLVKKQRANILFLSGIGISIVRNCFPKLFLILKMHR